MRSYRVCITPLSAFGTPLKGDTLFGQLCCAVRNHYNVARVEALLDGYTSGHPFVVLSDAFPAGHLPQPLLPGRFYGEAAAMDRKTLKKRVWLPAERFRSPVARWLEHARSASELPGSVPEEKHQTHNTLSRETGATGEGMFAPYAMSQLWYGRGKSDCPEAADTVLLDIYIVLDEERASRDEILGLLSNMGTTGFGRDASIGLGKFEVRSFDPVPLPVQDNADAWLTLAPCAPQGLSWNEAGCFYQSFTRFGRHGDIDALAKNPFKTPVLMADTGAVLTPALFEQRLFTGQGLGGDGSLSLSVRGTVHQGYAPVSAIELPKTGGHDEIY